MKVGPLLVALILVSSVLTAWTSIPSPTVATDESPLELQMSKLKSSLRRIRKNIGKPAKSADLFKDLTVAENALIVAKSLLPEGIDPKKNANKAKKFRLMMIDSLEAMISLEKGILQGKPAAEITALVKAIYATQDKGHQVFKK